METVYTRKELEQLGGEVIKIADVKNATESGDTKDSPHWVMPFKEADFYLVGTKNAGTSPTLDVKVIKKFPYSDNWNEMITFTQLTDSGAECKEKAANIGENLAVSYTIGGTDPDWSFTVYAVLKIK